MSEKNKSRNSDEGRSRKASEARAEYHGITLSQDDGTADADAGPMTAGTTAHGAEQRYWQCPLCKRYMDAYLEIDGMHRIASMDRIQCSECGCANLDTVEGEYFNPKHGEILKARYIPPRDKEMFSFVREGSAMMDDAGFFTEDPRDNEPLWPRYMTSAQVGVAMRLNSTLEGIRRQLKRIADGPNQRDDT